MTRAGVLALVGVFFGLFALINAALLLGSQQVPMVAWLLVGGEMLVALVCLSLARRWRAPPQPRVKRVPFAQDASKRDS
ncbi:MAG: hypothetical protein PF961_10910 [Planctomycetota bacterium]|jgi:hypothetical protein|nr:hypothetical protein [Planctomycetota bacterium]